VVETLYEHHSKGTAADGKIYRGNKGTLVMLGRNGRPYPVGADGCRIVNNEIPPGFDRELWRVMSPGDKRDARRAAGLNVKVVRPPTVEKAVWDALDEEAGIPTCLRGGDG